MAQHIILLLRDLKCLFKYSRNPLEYAGQFSEAKAVESFQNWWRERTGKLVYK
jgi:hypothetical protein